jgi:hypothetical protein
LGADGFEARYRESDAIRAASPNDVAQYLGGGEVDIENARRLQDDQPRPRRRGPQSIQYVLAETICVEKGQWRCESCHDDVGLCHAPDVRARRPPDRGSRHPLEDDDAGAGGTPDAVQKRERDPHRNTLFDREHDDGCGSRGDEQEFTKRLPIDRGDRANSDNSEGDEQQDAGVRNRFSRMAEDYSTLAEGRTSLRRLAVLMRVAATATAN